MFRIEKEALNKSLYSQVSPVTEEEKEMQDAYSNIKSIHQLTHNYWCVKHVLFDVN